MENFTELKYYDELTPEAQAQARRNVAASEAHTHSRAISETYREYIANQNKAVNDPYHILRLHNGQKALSKIRKEGDTYLIPYIRSNRLIFTTQGAYIVYLGVFTAFINGCEYIPTPDDQKLLREPYIEVNKRGPKYHMHRLT